MLFAKSYLLSGQVLRATLMVSAVVNAAAGCHGGDDLSGEPKATLATCPTTTNIASVPLGGCVEPSYAPPDGGVCEGCGTYSTTSYPDDIDDVNNMPTGNPPGQCSTDSKYPAVNTFSSVEPSDLSESYTQNQTMIDGLLCSDTTAHDQGSCYGACGAGCNTPTSGGAIGPSCCATVHAYCPPPEWVYANAGGVYNNNTNTWSGGVLSCGVPRGCTRVGTNASGQITMTCGVAWQNYSYRATTANRITSYNGVGGMSAWSSPGSCPGTDWRFWSGITYWPNGPGNQNPAYPWIQLGGGWDLLACSTHTGCFAHDECNRHDWRQVNCQVVNGIAYLGRRAANGTPEVATGFYYGWWLADGSMPLQGVTGTIGSENADNQLQPNGITNLACHYTFTPPTNSSTACDGGASTTSAADMGAGSWGPGNIAFDSGSMGNWRAYSDHNFDVQVNCPVHQRHHCKTGWFGRRSGCPSTEGSGVYYISGPNTGQWAAGQHTRYSACPQSGCVNTTITTD